MVRRGAQNKTTPASAPSMLTATPTTATLEAVLDALPKDATRATLDLPRLFGLPDAELDPMAVKRAFRKTALRFHPDRSDHPDATRRFQNLTLLHTVLDDPTVWGMWCDGARLAVCLDQEDAVEGDVEAGGWRSFLRETIVRVTREKLEELEREYRGKSNLIEALRFSCGAIRVGGGGGGCAAGVHGP